MIEIDPRLYLPEDYIVTWSCSVCGHTAEVKMAQLDSTQCPDCAQAGIGYVYDSSNPDEREVA
jgi:rubrerythrin